MSGRFLSEIVFNLGVKKVYDEKLYKKLQKQIQEQILEMNVLDTCQAFYGICKIYKIAENPK